MQSASVKIKLHISTVQDILADLGKASKVFYKEEDKMKIHSMVHDNIVLGKTPANDKSDKGPGNVDGEKGRRARHTKSMP